VILSDAETMLFVAASTKHDVLYTVYLQNVLMPEEEVAELFCLAEIPVKPADRRIADRQTLLFPAQERSNPAVREHEIQLINDACAKLDRNPRAALKQYGPAYVLWDEARHPEWDLRRFHVPLKKAGSGSGWSLWKLSP
jgi:hypothetical protein